MVARRKRGELELAVARLVARLREDAGDDEAPGLAVYALQAKKLAIVLDQAGPEFLATAAVSRELRECVKAMTAREVAGDGDDPATRELFARLSAPLGHTSN